MSYMRVARSRIDPGANDANVQLVGQDLVAAFKRQPGFQSFLSGVDADGQTIIVSTWDTEEHARFSRDALGDVVSRVQALGGRLDPPEFFEVTAQT